MRVGLGYDVHPLKKGEKLIIGGEYIPFAKGLAGHSDADVLTHALMDAILGAMGAGDIGDHFPDTDNKYKEISSLVLLQEVFTFMKEKNYKINNIDLVLVAEKPKIKPYSQAIINNYSNKLKINSRKINLKATTTENLGFVGREEGISAQAIVSLIDEI